MHWVSYGSILPFQFWDVKNSNLWVHELQDFPGKLRPVLLLIWILSPACIFHILNPFRPSGKLFLSLSNILLSSGSTCTVRRNWYGGLKLWKSYVIKIAMFSISAGSPTKRLLHFKTGCLQPIKYFAVVQGVWCQSAPQLQYRVSAVNQLLSCSTGCLLSISPLAVVQGVCCQSAP